MEYKAREILVVLLEDLMGWVHREVVDDDPSRDDMYYIL